MSDEPAVVYSKLEQALTALDESVELRESEAARLQAVVDARSADVAATLAELGHSLDDANTVMDLAVARRVYWRHPEVKVSALAAPLRTRVGSVYQAVGPIDEETPCRGGCGAVLRFSAGSREGKRTRVPKYCADCDARRRRAWEEAASRSHRGENDELWSAMREATASGEPLRPRVVEFEGVRGTWLIDHEGHPIRPL